MKENNLIIKHWQQTNINWRKLLQNYRTLSHTITMIFINHIYQFMPVYNYKIWNMQIQINH